MKFYNGEINVLSCSTTFELELMGVALGLCVMFRRLLPIMCNAGRAGRGPVQLLCTHLAQRKSHDFCTFQSPCMVNGRINRPTLSLRMKIIKRHMYAVALSMF